MSLTKHSEENIKLSPSAGLMRMKCKKRKASLVTIYMNSCHSIIAIVICLMAGVLQAKTRTCRVVFPERPQDAPKVAFLFDGKSSKSITLPSMNLSEVIELPSGPLTLALTDQEIRDPKLLPPNAPLIAIPEHVSDFYIIILPDPKNQHLPIKMNLVDAGDDKLKASETLWYNFTEHRIIAKLGTSDLTIEPKSRAISKAPAPASGYYIARFAYQANGAGAMASITEQSWWHDATSKHVGFMVNTGGKLPKLYYYRDFRISEEEKGSAEDIE
jgi:hypothetical protein